MSRCETVRDDLKAYLDGELSLLTRLIVRTHLIHCIGCRQEIVQMEQINNALKREESGSLDPALRTKILESTANIQPNAPAQPALPLWRTRPLAVWGTAAAVVLVWFVVFPLTKTAKSPTSTDSFASKTYTRNNHPAVATNAGRPTQETVVGKPESRRYLPPSGEPTGNDFRKRVNVPEPAMASAPSALGDADVDKLSIASFGRKVHKQAEITVAVDRIEPKSEAVEQIVQRAGGFVANNQLSTGDDNAKTAALIVRVPVAQFETVLGQIARLGTIRAKNVHGEDLTEQTSDAEQENHVLVNEIRYKEARLRARGDGRNTLTEEQAARHLRIELAQARARLQLLQKMAALATITVQMEEAQKEKQGVGFVGEMSDLGRVAVNNFLQAARLPFVLLIWIVAYAPVWAPLVIAYRYAVRAGQRRGPAPQSPQ